MVTRESFMARLRALGVRQVQFAELFGYAPMTVYNWGRPGMSFPAWVPVMLASWECLQAVHGADWINVLMEQAEQ